MRLPDGTPLAAIDATLGIPGAPQSASGQTALFCGAAAADIGQRHRNGYPDRSLRRIILKKNMLSRLATEGAAARYLNAYPAHEELFTARHVRIEADGRLWFSPEFPEHFRRMISVTSCMLLASGQQPFGANGHPGGRRYTRTIPTASSSNRGLPLPEFSPAQAAEVIARRLAALRLHPVRIFSDRPVRPPPNAGGMRCPGPRPGYPGRRRCWRSLDQKAGHPGPDQRPRQPGGLSPARPQPQPGAAHRLGQARRLSCAARSKASAT